MLSTSGNYEFFFSIVLDQLFCQLQILVGNFWEISQNTAYIPTNSQKYKRSLSLSLSEKEVLLKVKNAYGAFCNEGTVTEKAWVLVPTNLASKRRAFQAWGGS